MSSATIVYKEVDSERFIHRLGSHLILTLGSFSLLSPSIFSLVDTSETCNNNK